MPITRKAVARLEKLAQVQPPEPVIPILCTVEKLWSDFGLTLDDLKTGRYTRRGVPVICTEIPEPTTPTT